QGNKIGTNAAGTAAIPNSASGVRFDNATSNNTVGGTVAGAGNVIAFNNSGNTAGRGGGTLGATAGNRNSVLATAIYSNPLLGIDLNEDGVTANAALDAASGPNGLLNPPELPSVLASGGFLSVNIKLDAPAGSYRIEFFKNPSGVDPSTFGEGEVYAGSQNVTHPGGGAAYFSFSNAFAGAGTDMITATTTACTDGAACAAFGSSSAISKALAAHTTAVTLASFAPGGGDGAVNLSWTTASELSNLGFNLYRSLSASGPFDRVTATIIPGLGSSAVGTAYSYRDSGLTNEVTYFYKLED